MKKAGFITIECRFMKGTDNAYRVIDDAGIIYWIPASQVHSTTKDPKTDMGTITMTEWIAKQKGILE